MPEESFTDSDTNFRGLLKIQVSLFTGNAIAHTLTIFFSRQSCVCANLSLHEHPGESLDVASQVKRVVNEATSEDALSQMYPGWAPFM